MKTRNLGSEGLTLDRTAQITGHVLVLVGEEDHIVPVHQRRQIAETLQAAGVRHEIITYPSVGHGFLSDRRATYSPAAARDAWARVRGLFTA